MCCLPPESLRHIQGEEVYFIMKMVMPCQMPRAGGLAGSLLLLPEEEEEFAEASPCQMKPSQEGGQAVHVEAVAILI